MSRARGGATTPFGILQVRCRDSVGRDLLRSNRKGTQALGTDKVPVRVGFGRVKYDVWGQSLFIGVCIGLLSHRKPHRIAEGLRH
jgi:hypothetical protein